MNALQLRELLNSFQGVDDECEIVMLVEGRDVQIATIQRNSETAGPGGIVRLVSKTEASRLAPQCPLPSNQPFYIETGPWPTPDESESPKCNQREAATCRSYRQSPASTGVVVRVGTRSHMQQWIENRRLSSGGGVSDSSILPNVKCGGTAAQDSQSEANEGACPPLPPTSCSAGRSFSL
jgi:hypothetical protein